MRFAFGGMSELFRRIAFTLGALAIYRLGTFIPLPGIDPQILTQIFKDQQGELAGTLNVLSSGVLRRMAIFALGIGPFLSASFIILIITFFSKQFRKFASGERLTRLTRWLALAVAMLEAYGLAKGLEIFGRGGPFGSPVAEPGTLFRLSTVVTLTGGTTFLIWLAEQINKRGIGNGFALLVFVSIVAPLPSGVAEFLELGRTGALSTSVIEAFLFGAVLVIAFVVLMEGAQRRIAVTYAPRQLGDTIFSGGRSDLRFKLNNAGIIAPIAAASLVLLPASIANSFPSGLFAEVKVWLEPGFPTHMIVYAVAIIVVCFLYTALLLSPSEISRRMGNCGGTVANVRPGQETADYLDGVLTRVTVLGAFYVSAICILPEILIANFALPFYFGGSSLFVVVCVALDVITQVRALSVRSVRA